MGTSIIKKERRQKILGWAAVVIVTLIASFWAYWGGIENFHEGWYEISFWNNVVMMLLQYWLFPLIFIIIGLIGLNFPKINLVLCIILGIAAAYFFAGSHFSVVWIMIFIPLVGIGLLFFFGRPMPKWLVTAILAGLPVLILVVTTIIGGIRVSQRIDDGDYGARTIDSSSGVTLTWAPKGPGWPDGNVSYDEAKDICAHLSEDGLTLLDEPVYIWRLPTVEEAVTCQMLHGKIANGKWDEATQSAFYDKTPDKETPLWDPHSKVIYYWTDTMVNDTEAYIIVYHGGVFTRKIRSHYAYLSFRAVKDN